MKRYTKRKIKKILTRGAQELLLMIQEAGEMAVHLASTPYGKLRIGSMSRPTYYRSVRDLQKKGLIKKERKQYKNVYVLTKEGRLILRRRFDYQMKRRVDGFSTLIIFDIPEEKSRQRTMFRRYLLKHGYTLFQKSVFISLYEVMPEIRELLSELGIVSYVNVFSAKLHLPN